MLPRAVTRVGLLATFDSPNTKRAHKPQNYNIYIKKGIMVSDLGSYKNWMFAHIDTVKHFFLLINFINGKCNC